jgi:hypothetical protein
MVLFFEPGFENLLPFFNIYFLFPKRNSRIAGVARYRLIVLPYQ